jgi:hypothetical protein
VTAVVGGRRLQVEPLARRVLDGVVRPAEETRRVVDVGLLLWCEDERPLRGLAGFVDWRAHGRLSSMIRSGLCTGRSGESVLIPVGRNFPMRRLVLHGLGRSTDLTVGRATERARAAAEVALRMQPRDVLVGLPGSVGDRDLIEALFAGLTAAAGVTQVGCPWWVVVEERHVNRLRRLLEGPPRAAES